MSRAVETFAQRRFTVEEYHRLAEAGILSADERVELVRGVVREMSPKNRAHVIAINRSLDALREKLAGRARVYQEAPLRVPSIDSEPEPDVMVCSNPDIEAYGTESMRPVLVIEIADSSLAYDVEVKSALYAEAGVPEYWVVNLVDRVLEVFREPGEAGYRRRFTLEPDATVTPEAWPDVELNVAEFLA